MDAFPEEYTTHNFPVMAVGGVLSGLADLPMNSPLPPASAPALVNIPSSSSAPQTAPSINPSNLLRRQSSTLSQATSKPPFYRSLVHLLTTRAATAEMAKEKAMVFKVVVVEKNFQIPPRKPRAMQPGQAFGHSSISPRNQLSPLYPDGLMTPTWVQRHRETIPSVFVAFYELSDHLQEGSWNGYQRQSGGVQGPLDTGKDANVGYRERERDQLLVTEINEMKKQLIDRQIKFAAVLVLSKNHLDDPNIEERVSFVRRNAGLDAKNTFFVLPPSAADLPDFVANLHKSLFEHAVGYYREHGKRVKRKRSKLPALKSSPTSPIGSMFPPSGSPFSSSIGTTTSTYTSPTSAQGGGAGPNPVERWMFRYDFKAALFAEFRQDHKNAIKNFESAYVHVVDMLQPVSLFSPGSTGYALRSRRWHEAWEIADSINIKIIKLNLLLEDTVAALTQLNKHVAIFQELMVKWGMGERSFEYWAWLSKQYYAFATVLEHVVKIGLKLAPSPFTGANGSAVGAVQAAASDFRFAASLVGGGHATVVAGVAPSHVLQHPGYYYHSAAMCSVERWKCFSEIDATAKGSGKTAPFLADERFMAVLEEERATDHAGLTINLLTKAYEHFKRHRSSRMTLYLASEIADTHLSGGKFDVALKFFERIAKTYRKEGWNTVLTAILKKSLQCARELGSWGNVCDYVLEILSDTAALSEKERTALQLELFQILSERSSPDPQTTDNGSSTEIPGDVKDATTISRSQSPPNALRMPPLSSEGQKSQRSLPIDLDQVRSMFSIGFEFRESEAHVGIASPWQVTISTHPLAPPIPIRFSAIRVLFSDASQNHLIIDPKASLAMGGATLVRDGQEGSKAKKEKRSQSRTQREWVDCTTCARGSTGEWTKEANLVIRRGSVKVLEGVVTPSESQELKVLQVALVLATPFWEIAMISKISDRNEESAPRTPHRRWLEVVGSDEHGPITKILHLSGMDERWNMRVSNRLPKLDAVVRQPSPAMLDEQYPVEITLTNREAHSIQVYMDADIKHAGGPDVGDTLSVGFGEETEKHGSVLRGVSLGVIAEGGSLDTTVYVRGKNVTGERTLILSIRYKIASTGPDTPSALGMFERKEHVRIPFIHPFEASFEFHAQAITNAQTGFAEFDTMDADARHKVQGLLIGRIKCACPWEIDVSRLELDLETKEDQDTLPTVELKMASTKIDEHQVWRPSCVYHASHQVLVTFPDRANRQAPVDLGCVKIRWRRRYTGSKDGDPPTVCPFSITALQVPKIDIVHRDLKAVADLPPNAFVNRPFTITYTITNLTRYPEDVHLTVDVVEHFVFSGNRTTSVTIPSMGVYRFWHTCYALSVGRNYLPRVRLTKGKGAEQQEVRIIASGGGEGGGVEDVLEEGLSIFVKPRQDLAFR